MASCVHEILSIVRRNVDCDAYIRVTDDFFRLLQTHLHDVLLNNFQTIPETKFPKLFNSVFDELLDDRFVRGDDASRESLIRAIDDFKTCEAFEGLDVNSQDSY